MNEIIWDIVFFCAGMATGAYLMYEHGELRYYAGFLDGMQRAIGRGKLNIEIRNVRPDREEA